MLKLALLYNIISAKFLYILDIEFMNLIIMEQNRNRIGAEWVEFWSSGAEQNRETLEQNSDRPTYKSVSAAQSAVFHSYNNLGLRPRLL